MDYVDVLKPSLLKVFKDWGEKNLSEKVCVYVVLFFFFRLVHRVNDFMMR